jgi:outer membrane receptor for ferrienterochelin and colicin
MRVQPLVVISSNSAANNNNRRTGLLSGFQQRAQRHTFGRFITRDEIDKQHPIFVSDLLRTIPGLEVVPRLGGNDVRSITGCRPAVYLDGIRYPLMGETIDQIVSPYELEGIEVYTHPSEVPVEFQGPGSDCGVIALWTRTGA